MKIELFETKEKTTYSVDFKSGKGTESVRCPVCSESRTSVLGKKARPLSYDHDKMVGMCHHCDSHFVKRDRNLRMESTKKEYIRPKVAHEGSVSQRVLDFFANRGISEQTILDFRIGEGKEYMPQTSKEENTIQFNYFLENELINVKYRDGAKNFKLVKDAEPIFYNIDSIRDSKTCIICEGEIDAMSWHEAGFRNVVSVPNGANPNLSFLEGMSDYFENKDRIYLSCDNDVPGKKLRDELSRRLGYERCYVVDFGEHKDANEYLIAFGKSSFQKLLDSAYEYPIEGVYGIREVWENLYDIYLNGLPKGDKTGDVRLDEHIGFMPGELTVITGIPSHGKSIFLDQISLGLAIESNWKFAVCSPESYPLHIYFSRLIKRFSGKKFHQKNITPSELKQYADYLESRYFMIMPEEGFTLDGILAKCKSLVMKKGVNGFIIDPWNRIEKNQPKGISDGQWIAECLTRIIEFAKKSGVHIFLVAHPTKMMKEKDGINYMIPNLYSVSGSAHFFNMTHNGITVFRNYQTKKTEIHIQKVKWEHLGKIGTVEYQYNDENARFDSLLSTDNSDWMQTRVIGKKKLGQVEINSWASDEEPPF